MAHDVFISYSQKNKNTADAVCNALENNDIRCWIAPRDILPGKEWGEAIVTAISEAKVMVLIFSAASNESKQVLREVERAVNKNVKIIPFRIEDIVPTKSMEYFLYSTHWLDALTPDMSKHIDILTSTVANLISVEGGKAVGRTDSSAHGKADGKAVGKTDGSAHGKTDGKADSRNNPAESISSNYAVSQPDKIEQGVEKNKGKSGGSKLLLIAAGIVVLIAVAFGVYGIWLASLYDDRGPVTNPSPVNGQEANTAGQNAGTENAGTDENSDMGLQTAADGRSDLQTAIDGQPITQIAGKNADQDKSAVDTDAGEQGGNNQADGNTENNNTTEELSGNVSEAGQPSDDKLVDSSGDSKGTASPKGSAVQAADVQGTELKIGDYISFGTYYGQPIVWRVINVDDDGCPLLLSDKLLSFKCFDAAERENSPDDVRKTYGSNFWENSNIREWLNSSAKSVSYSTTAPTVENVCYGENSYASESGFLTGFTQEEQKLVKAHSHDILLPEKEKDLKEFGTEVFSSTGKAKMNRIYGNFDSSFGKAVKDKVFLLSIKELRDYVLDRGWDIKAAPIPQAEARDESDYEELKHETDGNWAWWLSTPSATTPDCVYFVSYDGFLDDKNAFLANTCIRPALYLSEGRLVVDGSGTEEDPYVR